MKMDDAYFNGVFEKIRLIWDTKHFIKNETVELLKQIAADAREEQAGKDRAEIEKCQIQTDLRNHFELARDDEGPHPLILQVDALAALDRAKEE